MRDNPSVMEVRNFLPSEESLRRLTLLRIFLGIIFLLGVLALIDQRQYADEIAVWAVSPNWRWAIRIGWVLVGSVGMMFASTWTQLKQVWQEAINSGLGIVNRLGALRWLLIIVPAFGFPVILLGPYGRFVLPFFTRLIIFWFFSCVGALAGHSIKPSRDPLMVFTMVLLIFGTIYRISVFSADVSTYPYSLGWSEVSRYYYASLFLSERIYGVSVPPSVLHPTRYMIQAIPFLIPDAGLLIHRVWQVVVWIGFTLFPGVVLARRLQLKPRWSFWLYALWVFLFLFQGPVWYHLLVMVVLIVWGTRTKKPIFTLGVVVLASLWAGISRVNWIPVPAMLAAMLYFLERKQAGQTYVRYYAWPIGWFVAGSVAGFSSQWLYILSSGNEAGTFGSSFDSPLLWYRLLPSGTYPLGVLPGILMAMLPIVLLIMHKFLVQGWKVDRLRFISILAIPTILFAGGIVVSVKIGGGSNLHNLDAFIVTLMILGVYTATNRWHLDGDREGKLQSIPVILFMAVIWIPIFFAIGIGIPLRSFDMKLASKAMEKIRSIVEPIARRDGKVLFISQRHLQTLGFVEGVDLIPEYETVFLMEMAMSRNEEYLKQLHGDLRAHRFDLIVVDRLSTQIQDRNEDFAEENNAWVEEVSIPILCYYDVADSISQPPLQFFIPKEEGQECNL